VSAPGLENSRSSEALRLGGLSPYRAHLHISPFFQPVSETIYALRVNDILVKFVPSVDHLIGKEILP